MELIKKNIHMDRVKRSTVIQFTMEEDLNLPEDKPDISTLNLEKGEVVIEEIRPGTDEVTVRGKLGYAILYHTQETGSNLVLLSGALPFEEKIHMEGTLPSDTVAVNGTVEDFTVNMINSRKLNLQALLLLTARIEEIYDEELPVGIQGGSAGEGVEYRISPMEVTELSICKNDIFRKKEEIPLPSSYPNIYQILWSNVSLRDVEFKPQEEKLAVQGDIQVFVLYEAEGEERSIRSYETTIPLNGTLECQGCREELLPDIRYSLVRQEHGQPELTIQPDLDGEERILGLECALELNIRLYEEEQIDILRDIYGVTKEVLADTRGASLRQVLAWADRDGTWQKELDRLEQEAAAGRQYLSTLRKEVVRLGLLADFGLRGEQLRSLTEKLDAEALEEMKKSLEEKLDQGLGLPVQLRYARGAGQNGGDDGSFVI